MSAGGKKRRSKTAAAEGLVFRFSNGHIEARQGRRLLYRRPFHPPSPKKRKAAFQAFFSRQDGFLIYGAPSSPRIYIIEERTGKMRGEHLFGKGLAAPVVWDSALSEGFFFTVSGYLHKIRLAAGAAAGQAEARLL